MNEAKSKAAAAWEWKPTVEEAKATILHLHSRMAEIQKKYEADLAAMNKDRNNDIHRHNEAYAALQAQLFAAQDTIIKLQDRLLKYRELANQPLS